ncbi:oxidoreductase, partial [Sinorhizobium medicae]
GMTLDHALMPMVGTDDYSTPREMGHFLLAIDPDRFGGRGVFDEGMSAYLEALRSAPAQEGCEVLAPGDREWRVEAARRQNGIPIDPDTAAFLGLSRSPAAPAGNAGEN